MFSLFLRLIILISIINHSNSRDECSFIHNTNFQIQDQSNTFTQDCTFQWHLAQIENSVGTFRDEFRWAAPVQETDAPEDVNVYVVDDFSKDCDVKCRKDLPAHYTLLRRDGRVTGEAAWHGWKVGNLIGSKCMGIAPNFRYFYIDAGPKLVNFYAAVQWVIENAKKPAILNLSVAFSKEGTYKCFKKQITNLISSGIHVVQSTLNDSKDVSKHNLVHEDLIVVGGIDNGIPLGRDKIRNKSAYARNDRVTLYAPSESIPNLGEEHGRRLNGNSYATPLVTGMVALLIHEKPWLSPKAAKFELVTRYTRSALLKPPTETRPFRARIAWMPRLKRWKFENELTSSMASLAAASMGSVIQFGISAIFACFLIFFA